VKIKYADCREEKDIKDRIYKQIKVDDYEFQGYVCYMNAVKIDPKFVVNGKTIMDSGYTKLEFYSPGKRYVLTAVYDDKDDIVELYFDISKRVFVGEDGVPTQEDMYIDVVIVSENESRIIDQDELEEAYKKGELTEKDYIGAIKMAEKINKVFSKFYHRVRKYTDNYYKELKSR